jgi:hypothetical protein
MAVCSATGKRRHASRRSARARVRRKQWKVEPNIYACCHCGGFHLTSEDQDRRHSISRVWAA